MSADSIVVTEKPKQHAGVLFAGMALFSMFFGAGNLIFPMIIGHAAGSKTPAALIGLAFSAVAFPFLGMIAMMFYRGNLRSFLERLGKWPAFALLFVLQMAQGPVGCLPRLVTLMHTSVKSFFPDLSLFIFSILICVVVFLLTFRPQKIVDLLGMVLTPILLLSLAVLIGVALIHPPEVQIVSGGNMQYFLGGLKGGYQTMDLIAAFLFATVIIPHLSHGTESLPSEEAEWIIRKRLKGASLIAAGLLMAAYLGLCWLSSHYSRTLQPTVAPEELLVAISDRVLGSWGGFISAITIFFACLTTSISLTSIFSEYLKKEIFKERVSSVASLIVTLAATAAMANLGFSGIVKLMEPILEIIYPALIVLCLINIGYCSYKFKPIKVPFYLVIAIATLCFYLRDIL